MISKPIIQEIAKKADIVEYLKSSLNLQKSGKLYKGCCPFCEKPSFVVYPKTQSFYCYHCNLGGDIFTYVMQTHHISYPKAVELLAKQFNISMNQTLQSPNDCMRDAALFYYSQLKNNSNAKDAINILHSWGIHGKTIVSLGLGFHDDSLDCLLKYTTTVKNYSFDMLQNLNLVNQSDGQAYDRMRNSIIIPIIGTSGDVIAFDSYNLIENSFLRYPSHDNFNRKEALYSLNLAIRSKKKSVLITSSYYDYFKLVGQGITNVVSTYLPNLSIEQAQLLSKYFRVVFFCVPIYVNTTEHRTSCRKCKLMSEKIPLLGCETPTEYIDKYGADEIKSKIEEIEHALKMK